MPVTPERMKELGCAVVIPTYNNRDTILGVIGDVAEFCDDIIVVNDGSTDGTQAILERQDNITLVSYMPNKGKGYALKQGLAEAAGRNFRYAITIDADGQHYADDIPAFIEEIELNPDSLIIGQRNIEADNMPAKNTFANKFSNFWFFVETGKKMQDTQSGYRLYPLHRIGGMKCITPRYEFELEVIVRAVWKGIRVSNVPVKVYYPPEGERVSHFRPFRDFFRISLLNIVLVLGALLYYHPLRFFRQLNWPNIKRLFKKHVIASEDSCATKAASIGLGVFWGIVPVWGYQMILAGVTAHFLKLNKVIAILASNISIPPMVPVIVYLSLVFGGTILGQPTFFRLSEMSLQTAGEYLMQYIVGSVALAVAAGMVLGGISYLIIRIKRRSI